MYFSFMSVSSFFLFIIFLIASNQLSQTGAAFLSLNFHVMDLNAKLPVSQARIEKIQMVFYQNTP